jgi:hypothetical protein
MTWADDDELDLAVRRHASRLHADPPEPARHVRPVVNVPVRAVAAGRDFTLEPVQAGWVIHPARTEEELIDSAGLVVVEVQQRRVADADTGEVGAETRYRCYRLGRGYDTLAAGEVNLDRIGGLDRHYAGAAARAILRPLVMRHQGRARQLDMREVDAIHDAWRLARAAAL